jgi:hypothetical protein
MDQRTLNSTLPAFQESESEDEAQNEAAMEVQKLKV